jgi:Fe-S-cluster containining protein
MGNASDSLECQICAACCFSGALRYVPVTGADYARLGDRAEDLVHFIGNKAFMRMLKHHCSALEFETITSKFSCSVYEQRPEACRELQSGSSACHGEKTVKAELVQLTIARHVVATPRETL